VTKPQKLAGGIAGAGLACAGLGAWAGPPWSWLGAWIGLACALVALAYLRNRPQIFGKQAGRLGTWRVLPVLPYVAAFRVAMWLRRARERGPAWHEVVPGLYVGARVPAAALPSGLELVVDLTSEWPAHASVRGLAGYRCLPVLDGSTPPCEEGFLDLVCEVALAEGAVYLHCEEGRGRAPTLAAAVLLARGVAADVASALELVCKARPVARPTRTDRRFLERIAPRLAR
jgi:protein-tyrosine phosphatase